MLEPEIDEPVPELVLPVDSLNDDERDELPVTPPVEELPIPLELKVLPVMVIVVT